MIRVAVSVEGQTEEEFVKRVLAPHLMPKAYVQRHEFESLLFADIRAFATLSRDAPQPVDNLRTVRAQFPTPEDINDSPATAPSKRIVAVLPRYRKRIHGPDVAERIGLNAIRAECPRFHDWLTRLESLQD